MAEQMVREKYRLRWAIVEQGQLAVESRQVYRRMKKLTPLRLKQLSAEYRRLGDSPATANRKALTDPRYLNYIEQVVEVSAKARLAKIRRETHLMYYYVMRQKSVI